jgi:hypothetical protein
VEEGTAACPALWLCDAAGCAYRRSVLTARASIFFASVNRGPNDQTQENELISTLQLRRSGTEFHVFKTFPGYDER